jgi:hypothetical protein
MGISSQQEDGAERHKRHPIESDVELRLQYEIKIKGMYFDFQPFLSGLRVRKIAKLGPMMV